MENLACSSKYVLGSLGLVSINHLETDLAVFFLKQSFPHPGNVNKMGLRHWLNHPLEHPNVYLVLFEAILKETAVGNSDIDLLKEAVEAVRNLQLKAFQMAMGRGPTGKFEWPNLVPEDVRGGIPKQVVKYQTRVSFFYGYR